MNRRLRQLFIGTQVAAVIGILNLIFFGKNPTSSDYIFYFRLDLIVYTVGVLTTSLLFILLNLGQYIKAITVFLWLWALIMAFSVWFGGGLYSPMLLSFPIILMFAALSKERNMFLSLFAFLALAIIFIALERSYNWFLKSEDFNPDGISRLIITLTLTSLSGYVCLVFGQLLNNSFAALRQENKRVIKSQSAIKQIAESDGLTTLLNRQGAETRYQRLAAKTNFSHEHIVGYFIDLDNFKSINDLFDHEVGDQLLITMSERLKSLVSEEGFICRFGGDEFVLVIQTDQSFDIEAFAHKALKLLAQPYLIFGTEAQITASIGITIISDSQESFNGLCKQADMAMYQAKDSGKNKFRQYTDQIHRQRLRNVNIVNGLGSALSNNLLDLHYQPKVNLNSNKIEGAEALVRWNRQNDEGVGPEEFIPIIENTELIHTIGAWAINKACRACKKWHDAGSPIKVAVNVSALQLTRKGFYKTVVDALQISGLPAKFFEIEITEHSLLQEVPLVAKQLVALKKLGVSLAIDDFGKGYSNMGYLTRLQIDTLKLDRGFISQLSRSEEHRVIVVAVIEMARILGMKVVAEGIETESERQTLLDMGCDVGQGYLWSCAVAGEDMLALNEPYL